MKKIKSLFSRKPTVAVVRLQGVIRSGGRGLDDASYAPVIEKAFRKGKPSAVALVINSPGGSPVQSSLIAARIRRLSEEKSVPVFAFVEDVAASGGYWLATAADEIYVDDSSITGSIGVISAGFGFPEFIERHGIERRVYTAGESKSQLDPFRPENPEDIARLDRALSQIHESFIAQVKARRGARLKENADIFTGEIWVGAAAVEQGLVDGVGHLLPVMKARFGKTVRFRRYGQKRGLFQRVSGAAVSELEGAVDTRIAFSKFGI